MLEVFDFLTDELGEDYWQGEAGNPGDGLVEMFYGQLDDISQVELPKCFLSKDCKCRCLVSTIAFGLGMQIADIEYVVHWGPPSNLLQYWQEIGRAGRDGRPSRAVLYMPPYSMDKQHVEDTCRSLFAGADSQCVRLYVLKHLQLKVITDDDVKSCCGGERCCTYCSQQKDKHMQVSTLDL